MIYITTHLGELLDRVRLRFETIVIERKGREVAAFVPAERARRLEAFARRRSIELEGVQDGFLREAGPDVGTIENTIAAAAREAKASRKARRR